MKTLAIVPARGGSKGIPRKNLREFRGKPLIAWAIQLGKETCDQVVVTTDDDMIRRTALMCGAKVIRRPDHLAEDETPMLPVVAHALGCVSGEPEFVVLLQPTQPLRRAEHVRQAVELLESEPRASSVVSVVEIPAHYSPEYALMTTADGRLWPFDLRIDLTPHMDNGPTRRQDCLPTYSRDGSVYAIRRQTLEAGSLYGDRCLPLVIPPHESVNLDTEEDWKRAESMVN